MEDELILSDKDRSKLDGIVNQMIENNEPDDNIQFVVNDFKGKYGVKKKRIFRGIRFTAFGKTFCVGYIS
jgi:hypothetical protein